MKFNQWELVSYSDIGKREENQDRELVLSGRKGLLAVIADGMGGHQNGSFVKPALSFYTWLSIDCRFPGMGRLCLLLAYIEYNSYIFCNIADA